MSELHSCTERLIKEAARRVFTSRGLAATRTEDIAVEAGVNKALVNYYYRSKERLFEVVFQEELQELTSNMQRILSDRDLSIFDKIKMLVDSDFNVLMKNPGLPLFVINEVARNPELMDRCTGGTHSAAMFGIFKTQIDAEIAKGTIKPIDPRMLWLNLVALVTMPFVARSWISHLFQLEESGYLHLMEQRRQHVADFIIDSIKTTEKG